MLGVRQWLADVGGPSSVAVWLTGAETLPADNVSDRFATVHEVLRSLAMPTSVHDDTEFCTSLDLPHRASVGHHARFGSGHGQTFLCH